MCVRIYLYILFQTLFHYTLLLDVKYNPLCYIVGPCRLSVLGMCECAKLLPSLSLVAKSCPTLATPWTGACQAPLSLGFSRQEYWNGFSCPPPGESSQPRIEPISLISLAVAGGFFTPRVTWEAPRTCVQDLIWK